MASAVLEPLGDNATERDPGYVEDAELLVLASTFGSLLLPLKYLPFCIRPSNAKCTLNTVSQCVCVCALLPFSYACYTITYISV